MKKICILILSAVLILSACSSNDDVNDNNTNKNDTKSGISDSVSQEEHNDVSVETETDEKTENDVQKRSGVNGENEQKQKTYQVTPISGCAIIKVDTKYGRVEVRTKCEYCGALGASKTNSLPNFNFVSAKSNFTCTCEESGGKTQYCQYSVSVN